MDLRPFNPSYGQNQVVTPAAASAAINVRADDTQVRICNSGAAIGYFRTFSSLAAAAVPALGVATVADCPVLAGQTLIVTKDMSHDRLAHISATGTTFQVMTGDGGFV